MIRRPPRLLPLSILLPVLWSSLAVLPACSEAPSEVPGKRQRDDGPPFQREEVVVDEAEAPLDLTEWTAIPVAEVVHESGHAYRWQLPDALRELADGSDTPRRSPLVLQEDGRDLGPAHAGHGAIRSEGSGRFSHWGGSLRFSASDNSDPRSNGRSYRFRVE